MNTTRNTNEFTNINSQNQKNYIDDFTVSVNNNPKEITRIATVKSTYNYVIKLFVNENELIKNTDNNITVAYKPNSSRKITWKNPTNGIESEPLKEIIDELVTNTVPAPTTPAPPAPVAAKFQGFKATNKTITLMFDKEIEIINKNQRIKLTKPNRTLFSPSGIAEIPIKFAINNKELTITIDNNTDEFALDSQYTLTTTKSAIKDKRPAVTTPFVVPITIKPAEIKEKLKTWVAYEYSKLGVYKEEEINGATVKVPLTYDMLSRVFKITNPTNWVKGMATTDNNDNAITFKDKFVAQTKITQNNQKGNILYLVKSASTNKFQLYTIKGKKKNKKWELKNNSDNRDRYLIYVPNEFQKNIQDQLVKIQTPNYFNEPSLEFSGGEISDYSSDEGFQPMQHRPSYMSYPSKSESKNNLYRY